MRRIAAISALVLVVAVFAYLLPAQDQRNDPFAPIVRETFGKPQANLGLPGSGPIAESIDVEPRISALANEFSKALISALQEKLIKVEQADRMVKELEIDFTVKRARIDLLRVARMLDKLNENTKGVDGSDKLGELRLQLKEFQAAAGIVEVEWVPQQEPTLATEAEQPKEE